MMRFDNGSVVYDATLVNGAMVSNNQLQLSFSDNISKESCSGFWLSNFQYIIVRNMAANTIALGFKDFSVRVESKVLLSNLNGFVAAGSITAVMGASASGKSLLLQSLSGRVQDLDISGKCFINGKEVNPKKLDNPIAYVPQDDSVIGELTAREVAMNSAVLKRNEPREQLAKDVDILLESLGLSKVADGIIGTLIFRGLSGGQKKRVEVISELIASPSILLLDEPTSGLDSSIAFEVLVKIRDLVKASNGKLSVILSVHQPNSALLELFDHLLLLDRGSSIFFGTLDQSIAYFEKIGFLCPPAVTPTDYFLKISDSNFNYSEDFDFKNAFSISSESTEVITTLEECRKLSKQFDNVETSSSVEHKVPFWRQVYVLVYREYTLGYRDPTLYYLQVCLFIMFSFFTGAIFLQLPRNIDENFNIITGGLLWMTLTFAWASVFKVYHLSKLDKRIVHELSNNKYSVAAVFVADSFSVATLMLVFLPTLFITYFMMGFPAKALPFVVLCSWVTIIGSEAMLAVITKFSHNPTTSMIFCQMTLVIIMVFGGGVFLPWKDCPKYWIWLQETTIVTQASRSIIMEVLSHMTFRCLLTNGVCISPGTNNHYTCYSYDSDGFHCAVQGREILAVTQGVGTGDNYWYYFAYLVAITLGYKVTNLVLTYYPVDRIYFALSKKLRWGRNDSTPIHYSSNPTHVGVSDSKAIVKYEPVSSTAMKDDEVAIVDSAVLTWTDLSVVLPKTGKRLIDNVSGMVSSGRVLALMGPSGAGKTTLLNGMSGRAKYARVEGDIQFSGRKMTSADLTYVPQFDELNGVFTVFEHFIFIGNLTCVDNFEMKKRADHLMTVLGLKEKMHVPIKNLSGGEIKRVSVGIGMISKPNVLFLDEPTTGLDSTAAFSIVSYISKIAKSTNVAVIMTIHQPSALVFNMLDDLFLLESGRLVYKGSIPDAIPYFTSIGYGNPKGINPADYYLDLAQGEAEGSSWQTRFEDSRFNMKYLIAVADSVKAAVSKPPPAAPSSLRRFGYMLRYFLVYYAKEKGLYFYRMLALIFLAIFVGTLYLNLQATSNNIPNYAGAMFFSAISVSLTAVSATGIFAKDRREAVERVANGFYNPGIYVLSQFLASTVYTFVVGFVFACIFHWLTNLNPNGECFAYDFLITWVLLMLMESALLMVIEVLKNDFLCTTFGLIFIGSNMVFTGFFRKVEASPVWINWMCYVVPFKWAFDGFVYQIFHSQTFTLSGVSPTVTISGDDILSSSFDLRDTPSWGLWAAVFGYVLLFRIGQYFLFALQTGKLPFWNRD